MKINKLCSKQIYAEVQTQDTGDTRHKTKHKTQLIIKLSQKLISP